MHLKFLILVVLFPSVFAWGGKLGQNRSAAAIKRVLRKIPGFRKKTGFDLADKHDRLVGRFNRLPDHELEAQQDTLMANVERSRTKLEQLKQKSKPRNAAEKREQEALEAELRNNLEIMTNRLEVLREVRRHKVLQSYLADEPVPDRSAQTEYKSYILDFGAMDLDDLKDASIKISQWLKNAEQNLQDAIDEAPASQGKDVQVEAQLVQIRDLRVQKAAIEEVLKSRLLSQTTTAKSNGAKDVTLHKPRPLWKRAFSRKRRTNED